MVRLPPGGYGVRGVESAHRAMSSQHVELVATDADMLQIGTCAMHNFNRLRAAGRGGSSRRPWITVWWGRWVGGGWANSHKSFILHMLHLKKGFMTYGCGSPGCTGEATGLKRMDPRGIFFSDGPVIADCLCRLKYRRWPEQPDSTVGACWMAWI